MPWAYTDDGTRIHYEVFGNTRGEPLLMIQGLGADSRGWIRQRRAFGSAFRCIAIDNRGTGRSDKPPAPYALEEMGRDAVAVLDAAGIESAHVMGASMGGVLAQILGVRHPWRVRSLVLACTSCQHHPWRRELLEEWVEVAEQRGMRAFTEGAARWLVGPRSLHRFWPLVGLLGPLALQVPVDAFVAQVRAILDLDDALRVELADVTVPTLVLVGSQDVLTPVGDSEEIVARVPRAELSVIGGGAHGFMFEHAGSYNRVAVDWLRRVADEQRDVSAA